MLLKVVRQLLRIGVKIGINEVAELVELDPIGDGLPPEVASVVIVGGRLPPLAAATEHRIADQT